jgi:2'-5' RNA ligase
MKAAPQHEYRCLSNIIRNKRGVVVPLALVVVAFVVVLWKIRPEDPFTDDHIRKPQSLTLFNPNLFHSEARCQKTMHFPFRVGCPHDCSRYRSDSDMTKDDSTDFYRLTIEWYFGEPDKYDANIPWSAQRNSSQYKQGINFQCPASFVKTFQSASRELVERVHASIPDAKVKKQKRMHMSLSYLCCLTADEVKVARPTIEEWIAETRFDFFVRFGEIQCWYERPNSVTTIVLVDPPSQRVLMKLNNEINDRLRSEGVPIVVPREDQMPFHSTLAGIYFGESSESYNPLNNISSQLPVIHAIVQKLSNSNMEAWNPSEAIRVLHDPRSSSKGELHTFPLIDYNPP